MLADKCTSNATVKKVGLGDIASGRICWITGQETVHSLTLSASDFTNVTYRSSWKGSSNFFLTSDFHDALHSFYTLKFKCGIEFLCLGEIT